MLRKLGQICLPHLFMIKELPFAMKQYFRLTNAIIQLGYSL